MVSWDLNRAAADNNIVLPPKATIEVKALCSTAETKLLSLDEEVSRAELILSEHRARKMQVIAQIKTYNTVIAPHRKLPNEILLLIFCHATVAPFPLPYTLTPMHVVIGQICKKWREISHGSPSIWSNVSWRGGEHYSMSDSESLRVMKHILSRSANAPLTLEFQNDPGLPQSETSSQILCRHAGQFKSLTIDRGIAPLLAAFLTLPSRSIDRLEHVDLTLEKNQKWDDFYISVFRDAPSLRKVKLTLPWNFNPYSLNLPWTRLTDLSMTAAIGQANNPKADTILRQSPLLVNLSLDIWENEVYHLGLGRGAIHLDYLQTFHLNLHNHQSNLLQHLVMPNLTKIVLRYCKLIRWKPEYTTHVTHSGNLREISTDIPIPTDAIDAILTHNPYLLKLRLPSSEDFSIASLKKMAVGELVPRLETLECSVEKEGPAGVNAHLDMLQSRRSMGTAVCSDIRTLDFRLRSQFDPYVSPVDPEMRVSPCDEATVDRICEFNKDGWLVMYV